MRQQRVAVVRALQLGDLLVAIPARRALRRGLPEARVTLIGLPWTRSFVARFSEYLDDFVDFPGWPARPERPLASHQVPALLAGCQAREFDLALQLHGSGQDMNDLVQLIGVREAACFTPARGDAPPGRSVEWPEVGAEVDRCLALVRRDAFEAVGGFDERLEVAWREDSDLEWTLLERGFRVESVPRAAVVHPARGAGFAVSLSQRKRSQHDAFQVNVKANRDHRERASPTRTLMTAEKGYRRHRRDVLRLKPNVSTQGHTPSI